MHLANPSQIGVLVCLLLLTSGHVRGSDVFVDLGTNNPRPRDVVVRPGDRIIWQVGRGLTVRVRGLEGEFDSGVLDDANPSFARVYSQPGIFGYALEHLSKLPPHQPTRPTWRQYGLVEVLDGASGNVDLLLNCPTESEPYLTGGEPAGPYLPVYVQIQSSPRDTNGLSRMNFSFNGTLVGVATNWPFLTTATTSNLGPVEIVATAVYEDGRRLVSPARRIEIQWTDNFVWGRLGVPRRIRDGFYLMSYQIPPSAARWHILCREDITFGSTNDRIYDYRVSGSGRVPVLSERPWEFMYCYDEY